MEREVENERVKEERGDKRESDGRVKCLQNKRRVRETEQRMEKRRVMSDRYQRT